MANLFAIGVTNATVATVLAIMVWCVTRVWRQPPLAQLLWVLVLIKLVTPPLISIPWHFGRSSVESTTASDDASTRRSATTLSTEQVTANRPAASENLNDTIAPNIPALERVVSADGKEELYGVISPKIDAVARGPLDWIMLAVTAWLAGSVLWLLIAILRLARFNDALKNTVPCPDDVCSMAAEVAAKLGATGRFRLRLTDARLSPLVWPVGRPTIVLSRPLLGELSREETKTLLAHELAHLLRKDHWLRWFELFVTAVYWWHPVVWWSRHMIQKAEEQACDAWVVWAFPDAARGYASALFKAVQMMSEHRPRAPLVASRLGSTGNLKERIEDIMNAKWKCRLTLPVRVVVVLVALLLLPFSLKTVTGADEPAPESKAKSTTVNNDEKQKPDATKQDRYTPSSGTPTPTNTAENAAARPERIRPGMRIGIEMEGTPPKHWIGNVFTVEPGGTVALGPVYGRVRLEGMTIEEAEAALTNHLKTIVKDPHVQVTFRNAPADQRQSDERVSPQELDALREHVQFLEEQFKKEDALYQTGSRGGSADKRAITAYELATAQCDLALAEGHRDEAIKFAEQAAKSSEEALKSTTASYEAGRLPLDLLLKTARYASESKRRLLRLRNPQTPSAGETQRASTDSTPSQRPVQQTAAEEPSSVRYWNKVVESKKRDYERSEALAKANTISAAELDKAKLDYELSVVQYEHAKRNLRYAQLQLELAETDYQQALDANKASPHSIPEFELRKLRIKVDMAKVRLSDVE